MACAAGLCERCRMRNTGWVRINGLCPACEQGVNVMTTTEMMEERRQQMERAREMPACKARDAYIHEIEAAMDRLMRRRREEMGELGGENR